MRPEGRRFKLFLFPALCFSAGEVDPAGSAPLFQTTVVVMRGSLDTASACRPPQDWPMTAIFVVSSLFKNGLDGSAFCLPAQLIASSSK
jgi:hypothetical protein